MIIYKSVIVSNIKRANYKLINIINADNYNVLEKLINKALIYNDMGMLTGMEKYIHLLVKDRETVMEIYNITIIKYYSNKIVDIIILNSIMGILLNSKKRGNLTNGYIYSFINSLSESYIVHILRLNIDKLVKETFSINDRVNEILRGDIKKFIIRTNNIRNVIKHLASNGLLTKDTVNGYSTLYLSEVEDKVEGVSICKNLKYLYRYLKVNYE
jgi:hypothetical protein